MKKGRQDRIAETLTFGNFAELGYINLDGTLCT